MRDALAGRRRRRAPRGEGRPRGRPRRRRRLRLQQRPRHRRRAAGRTPPGSAGSCWPARWWSTAKAPTTARSTAGWRPGRARRPDLRAGRLRPAVPALRRRPRPGLVTRTPRSTRATCTPRPRCTGAPGLGRGRARPAAPALACGSTTSTVPACRATRPTPASPRSSGRRSPPVEPPQVFEDGGQRRDFVHVDDVAPRPCGGAGPRPPRPALAATTSGRGRCTPSASSPRRWRCWPADPRRGDRAVPARRRPAHHRIQRRAPRSSAGARPCPSRLASGRG